MRCFRFHLMSLLECFRKITERFRNSTSHNIRHFQSTKPKQDSILCVSNFPMNDLKFWCFDSNLSSSGQARFYVFHSYITFWLTLWRDSFLLLAIGNKPISLLAQNAESSLLWSQTFFFFFYCVKLKLHGSEFHEFY